MSHDGVKDKISFEMIEIDKLIESYSVLLDFAKIQTPGLIEVTALATVLHSFYNGIEKIFVIIGKEIDGKIPSGIKWHRDLLIQMNYSNARREWRLSNERMLSLNEYLGFRHFFRHVYSFQLSWDKLEGLSRNMISVWDQIKSELTKLIK